MLVLYGITILRMSTYSSANLFMALTAQFSLNAFLILGAVREREALFLIFF